MRRLQVVFIVFIGWFFFFYNIERLSEPINIASFVYVEVALSAIVVMLIPVHRVPMHWLTAGALVIFVALKHYFGYPFFGRNMPITVTEIVAIATTLLLSRIVIKSFTEAREAVAELTLSQLRAGYPFEAAQSLIYREIRRARLNNRPLALLAIAPEDSSLSVSIDRFVKEAQEEIIKRYIDARIADMLLDELQDYNIVTQRNNHFIALLAEASPEKVQEVIERLQSAGNEKLGVRLQIGHAHFPGEAVTFEQLVVNAEHKMKNGQSGNRASPTGDLFSGETATVSS